ncbi:hypothetical protein CBM2605_A230040 [Cupriavidus neocaledonicus]|uniref:Uncharacterized protein n=1 Tax=Cupriavidus neocaledonicus TaxID=1040979 RepID=A0ABY1V0F5_9BURK|nr:hypothetical protein CBM2605_A230040 [Cupriavidus neocaledonicus]
MSFCREWNGGIGRCAGLVPLC